MKIRKHTPSLLVFLVFLFGLHPKLNAQIDTRYKMKATAYSIAYFDKDHDLVLNIGWRDTSLILVMTPKEKKLTIYGPSDKVFDITKPPSTSIYSQAEYLKWSSCIDPKGVRCNIRISSNNEKNNTGMHFFFIDYADVVYTYLVKEQ